MEAEKWAGGGIIGALVMALGYLKVRRESNADTFQNSQQIAKADITATAIARADKAQARVEELIRDMHDMTKASDAKINKLEMDLHESLYKRKQLLRDFEKLARIVRSSDRKEVLDYIQHTEFGSLD